MWQKSIYFTEILLIFEHNNTGQRIEDFSYLMA